MTDFFSLRSRLVIGVVSLALCFFLIGFLVINGNPDNSLHQSALAWAFTGSFAILGGFGFGKVLEVWNSRSK